MQLKMSGCWQWKTQMMALSLLNTTLNQRGPGEFLGTRQSGYTSLRLANLTDVHLIEKARHYAQQVFENDPNLTAPETPTDVGRPEPFLAIQ